MAAARRLLTPLFLALLASLLTAPASADDPARRQGAVHDGRQAEMAAGLTVTGQSAEGAPREGLVGSLDLVADLGMGPGVWTLYVEGNTTPGSRTVAGRYPQANGDTGTALDGDGAGRMQVSELYYSLQEGRWLGVAGLLDTTGFLDASAVANDETIQFLGTSLVNNPAIPMPDYSLGAAAHYEYTGSWTPGWSLVATGSTGLADQSERSYAELFDLDEPGEGAFLAAEAYWQGRAGALRLGAWADTAQQAEPGAASGRRRGAFAVADWLPGARFGLNLRAGWARPEASRTRGFLGAAAQWRIRPGLIGLGYTHTRLSGHGHWQAATERQAELYLRYPLVRRLGNIAPHVQWLEPAGEEARWVGGVRSTWNF